MDLRKIPGNNVRAIYIGNLAVLGTQRMISIKEYGLSVCKHWGHGRVVAGRPVTKGSSCLGLRVVGLFV